MICTHCHSEIADDSMFCTECGAKVDTFATSSMQRPSARVCPHCGNDIPADAEFCTMCGARLEAGDDAALTTAVGSEPESVPDPACPHCGAPLMDGAEFCTQCGSKADASGVSQTEGEI